MAIAFSGSGGVTGTSFSFDIGTANTNRLITVIAGDESTGTNLLNVTVNSERCNLVEIADNPAGLGNHQELWYIDETGLSGSEGSVTVAIVGGDAGWAVHAMLHTGVDQNGPVSSGSNNTVVGGTTIDVTGIDCSENGLVVAGYGNGNGGFTQSGITSPLVLRQNGPDPSSADLFSNSGVESSAQTNKTYTQTLSATITTRATGIVATWDEFKKKQVFQMII